MNLYFTSEIRNFFRSVQYAYSFKNLLRLNMQWQRSITNEIKKCDRRRSSFSAYEDLRHFMLLLAENGTYNAHCSTS